MSVLPRNLWSSLSFIGAGIFIGVLGIRIGEADDSPGVALASLLVMVTLITIGLRKARNKPRPPGGSE